MGENGKLLVYLVVGSLIGIYLFFSGFKTLKFKRLIENIPTSKIRSLAIGFAEVKGKIIKRDELLESPLSKEKCVYYKLDVEVLRRTRRSHYWQNIIKMEKGIRFHLKDNTGKILVDPTGAKLDLPVDFEFEDGFGKRLPESVKEFSKLNNLNMSGLFKKTYRFIEYYIKENEDLYILGYAGKNPEKSFSEVGAENLMVQKGDSKVYYISDKHEENILKSLTRQIGWKIYGGPALTIFCFLGIVWIFF